MPRFVLLVVSLSFALFSSGQNLVVNGGFEEIDTCEISDGDIGIAIGWDNLYQHEGGANIFNACCTNDSYIVPENLYGNQEPMEGFGYGGFIAWAIQESPICSLHEELEKDTFYTVSFGISLVDNAIRAYSRIGVKFWDTLAPIPAAESQNILSDYTIPGYITEKGSWQNVQFLFQASGEESFLSFGFYGPFDSAAFISLGTGIFDFGYYLIDNVVVRKATQSEINTAEEYQTRYFIYPNPASSTIRVSTSGNEKPRSVVVSNPAGQVIRQERFAQELDVSELPPGVYFLRLLFDDGSSAVRRFVRM